MVYECLQCKAAQQPGAVACPSCGTAFSGPVPADATLPAPAAPAAPLPDLAGSHAPLPPAWEMPSIPPAPAAAPPQRTGGIPILAIAGSVAAVLVLGLIIFWIYNAGQNAMPPPESSASAAAMPPLHSPPPLAPQGLVEMPDGAAVSGDNTTLAAPVGRWMDKQYDYYDFDSSGSGTRGNVGSGKPPQSFTYIVVKKQLQLEMAGGGTQKVPFSYGPSSQSIFIQEPGGRYLEYMRQG